MGCSHFLWAAEACCWIVRRSADSEDGGVGVESEGWDGTKRARLSTTATREPWLARASVSVHLSKRSGVAAEPLLKLFDLTLSNRAREAAAAAPPQR
jgi:hypothetical protein